MTVRGAARSARVAGSVSGYGGGRAGLGWVGLGFGLLGAGRMRESCGARMEMFAGRRGHVREWTSAYTREGERRASAKAGRLRGAGLFSFTGHLDVTIWREAPSLRAEERSDICAPRRQS